MTWWALWRHQPKPVELEKTPELLRLERVTGHIYEKADKVQAALDRLLSTEGHTNGA